MWPEGWPRENYSLLPLRASVIAERHGRLREFSRAAFRWNFGENGQCLTYLLASAQDTFPWHSTYRQTQYALTIKRV